MSTVWAKIHKISYLNHLPQSEKIHFRKLINSIGTVKKICWLPHFVEVKKEIRRVECGVLGKCLELNGLIKWEIERFWKHNFQKNYGGALLKEEDGLWDNCEFNKVNDKAVWGKTKDTIYLICK